MYGAVSNFTRDIIISRDKKTETESYIDFLEMIKEYHEKRYMTDKIYLVLDNHSVHRAKLVKQAYGETFKLLFLPAYSSYLSGVETLWAILKLQLGKHLDRIRYDMAMT